MDLGASIIYNGHTASGLTAAPQKPNRGCVIERVSPIQIDAIGFLEKRALHDGLDAGDVYLAGRNVAISAGVYGTSAGDVWDQLDSFVRAYSPVNAFDADEAEEGFLAFKFFRPTADIATWPTSAYPNGIPLQAYLRPARVPAYDLQRMAVAGNKGFSIPVTVPMVARNPGLFLQSVTSISISSSTQTATNRGGHPTNHIITFSMSAAGSTAAQFIIDNFAITLDLSTTTTGTFTIDISDGQVYDSNNLLANRLLNNEFTQYFRRIKPGGSTIRRANATGMSSSTTAYREAWL